MITAASFRALCLAFPGATESPHFDRAGFRAGGRMFATLAADGKSGMVKLDLDTHEALLKAEPEAFFSFGGWSWNGATGVTFAKVKKTLLRELLRQAYASATRPKPKRAPARKKPLKSK